MPEPSDNVIVGNHWYSRCSYCRKFVKMNKWLFGSLHVCLSPEEKHAMDVAHEQMLRQMRATQSPLMAFLHPTHHLTQSGPTTDAQAEVRGR